MTILKRTRGRAAAPFVVFAALCAAFSEGQVLAQVTDRLVYPAPNYGTFLPPALEGTYGDPVFHSTVKRLSDATKLKNDASSSGNVSFVTAEYSTMTPFNQDNSRLLLQHLSYYGLYDGTGKFIRNLPFEVSSGSEPRWSRATPNVLYYHQGNQLKRLDTAKNTISLIHQFSEYSTITGAGESDICFDGDHMIFAGDNRFIFVYELSTDTKGPVLDVGGQSFDSLYLTPDDHVTVTWTSVGPHAGVEMFDRNMTFLRRLAPKPGHMDVTRDVNGDEVLLWSNAADPHPICENGVVKIRMADATQTCVVTFDWSLAIHISATDNSDWFFVETYAPDDPVTAADWKPYTNEVVQVKLDGSEVRRIAHHRSHPFDSYNYTPRVSSSRDGSRIVYTSNYGMKAVITTAVANISGVTASSGALLRSLINSIDPTLLAPMLQTLSATIATLPGYINTDYTDAYLVDLGTSTAGTAIAGSVDPPGILVDPSPNVPPAQLPIPTQVLPPGHYDQNNIAIVYTGTWQSNALSLHEGGGAALSVEPGARVILMFDGTGIAVKGFRDEWSGIAKVYIDGDLCGTLNTYRAPAKAQTVLFSAAGLVRGRHTLAVEVTGTREARSKGSWVWIDGFDVAGTTNPASPLGSLGSNVPGANSDFAVEKGGASAWTGAGGSELKAVYGRVAMSNGAHAFSGLTIFSTQVNGVRVSETSVQARPLVSKARIFANVNRASNTGVAVVNPQDLPVNVAFLFTDSDGQEGTQGFLILGPHEKIARFATEPPFVSDATFEGTLTLKASSPVAVTGFQGLTNERSEFLMSAAPVLNLDTPAGIPTVLAHYANDGYWTSQVLLLNPGDTPLSGYLTFFDDSGGLVDNRLPYQLPPRAGLKVAVPPSFQGTTGSVAIVPDPNNATPWGTVRLTYRLGNITVNEASLSAVAASGFRVYAEAEAGLESALAIMNLSNSPAVINMELTAPDGIIEQTASITLPGRGRLAKMLTTFFPELLLPFKGVLHIAGTTPEGISVAAFRARYNERGEFMATSTEPAPDGLLPVTDLFLPHIVAGQGYTTELVLFNAEGAALAGTLQLFEQSGDQIPTLDLLHPVH